MSTTTVRIPAAEIAATFKQISAARDSAAGIADICDVTPTTTPAPAPAAAPKKPVLLLPARCMTTVQAEERAARRAAVSAARKAAVERGKAAGAARAAAALDELHAHRRALIASGSIPTKALPAEARQPMYAKDSTQYKLTMSDPRSLTVIFKVSATKHVVWFKLDNCYYRECVANGKPVHLTVFAMPPAAVAEAPAGAEALDFAAA